MDPNACYQRWLKARRERDADECREAWEDLTRWLENGGFEPTGWNKYDRNEFKASCGGLL